MDIGKLKKVRRRLRRIRLLLMYTPVKYHSDLIKPMEKIGFDIEYQKLEEIIRVQNKESFKYPCKIREIKEIQKSECTMCSHLKYFNYLVQEFNHIIKEYCIIFSVK